MKRYAWFIWHWKALCTDFWVPFYDFDRNKMGSRGRLMYEYNQNFNEGYIVLVGVNQH